MIKKARVLFGVVSVLLFLVSCASVDRERVIFTPPVFPPPPEKARFIWERMFVSSADVKEQTAMDKFRQFATGTRSSAEGLSKPWGVAVFQGRIYVTDTVGRDVAMFDVPGRDFKIIGNDGGPGQLTKPIAITTSKVDGTVYVADITSKRVVAYDKDGNFLRAFGGMHIFNRPTGVAVSPDGLTLWVVDNGGVDSPDHHLYKFDAISGELLKTIGTRGREDGQFNLPLEAATGPDGTVYVVDGGNFRIEAFNPDGTFKMAFGAIGRKSGQFSRPKGISTDPEGNIYVVDSSFGNFQIFDNKGELLLYIGEHSFKGMPSNYVLPAGIAVDEDGRVYVVDQYYRRIDVYRPADLPMDKGYLSSTRVPNSK